MSGVGSTEPPKSEGAGSAGAGAEKSGVGSTEPPKSGSGYEILGLDDLDRLRSTDGTLLLRPLRRRLDFRPFGLNAWEAEQAEDQLIEPHREESGTEELYVIVRGTARFTLGEETFDAPTGTLVHARPGTFRSATAVVPGTIALACGAEAGKAFTPSGWEDFYVAFALLRAGETDRARKTMQEALEREPDAWQGQYNAACFEALAGETDAAFDHLQRAIGANREVVEYAADDDDLASLREDARYAELTR
jgi:tetratricopeptide (TPR) repeat protein